LFYICFFRFRSELYADLAQDDYYSLHFHSFFICFFKTDYRKSRKIITMISNRDWQNPARLTRIRKVVALTVAKTGV
jgi:hypothetical protein